MGLSQTTLPTVDPYLRGPHATGHLRTAADSPYVAFTTMSPSESWTAGAMVATAADVATFLDGLLSGKLLRPDYLARMTDPIEPLDEHRSRGLGIVRFDFGTGNVAYGHHGGAPGYTTVAARTESGRCVVVWQNGIDLHNPLSSDTAPGIRTVGSDNQTGNHVAGHGVLEGEPAGADVRHPATCHDATLAVTYLGHHAGYADLPDNVYQGRQPRVLEPRPGQPDPPRP